MKIALFGGTFDPPHIGHQQVADALISKGYLDEVWFVPVYEHPWADRYQKTISPYEDRVNMLEAMTAASEFSVSQKTAHFKSVSFTLDTLVYFKEQYPEHTFFWVMGSEYLPKFEDFLVEHPELMEHPFLIYPRAGYEPKPQYGNMLVLEDVPVVKASSTEVRQAVKGGKDSSGLTPRAVQDYIRSHSLYK